MAIENTEFDVIVIGAGINGAGIARDAAMRGLKVLLLDKGDMGGGTSSWSYRAAPGAAAAAAGSHLQKCAARRLDRSRGHDCL
jgi:glycine/D-amino acid oxidase-like deaminating enzyme